MRKLFALLLIILLPALLAAQSRLASQFSPLAFTHVTLIDVKGVQIKRDMTVIIRGKRITTIGKSFTTPIPKNARVINATGKFLIPGLWDMHVHLGDEDFDKSSYLRL